MEQPRKKVGRPKGSKDSRPRKRLVDPKTGISVNPSGVMGNVVMRMGDEKVTAFVAYHMECLKMREGVDKRNVPDLYQRFYRYLAYCAERGIIPNNMNCYLAIGINREDIRAWTAGDRGTPEHRQFASDVKDFFASIHEQGALDGLMNPISSIFWQKAYDGMIEASKAEVQHNDPMGDRKSAEEIAKSYADLPD